MEFSKVTESSSTSLGILVKLIEAVGEVEGRVQRLAISISRVSPIGSLSHLSNCRNLRAGMIGLVFSRDWFPLVTRRVCCSNELPSLANIEICRSSWRIASLAVLLMSGMNEDRLGMHKWADWWLSLLLANIARLAFPFKVHMA